MKARRIYISIAIIIAATSCDSTSKLPTPEVPNQVEAMIGDTPPKPNPMFEVIKSNDIDQLEDLYEVGHPVDSLDANNQSLLHHAIKNQMPTSVKWLLNHGADPKGHPNTKKSPLPLAVELAHKCEPNTQESINAYAILKLLIQFGADPTEHYNSNQSAIQHAMDITCEACITFMKKTALAHAASKL